MSARAHGRQGVDVLQAPRRQPHLWLPGRRGEPGELDRRLPEAAARSVRRARRRARDGAVPVHVVGLDRESPRKGIMLGREPDRQQEMDEACEIVRNAAAAGIPAINKRDLLGVLRDHADRRPRRHEVQHLAPCRSAAESAAHGSRACASRSRLGAHHLLPRTRRSRRQRIQGAARVSSARPRRAGLRIPGRRARAWHGRRPEAVRLDQGQPVSRPQPVPRQRRRDAAAAGH